MSRRIEQDGKYFRVRRGKLVQIPPEWVGVIFYRGKTRRINWKRYFQRKDKRRKQGFLKRELQKELRNMSW